MLQETIRYPCFKPEMDSQAHKDPYTWNIKTFQKFKKFKFYPKILKVESKRSSTILYKKDTHMFTIIASLQE